ncbi:DDE-type integrase/transposase/recombinase, partial [Mycobacterium sp.]|uniref:DDE-type integrase/transposase/recombinase n=1 Tax=Mycobacterium sp. TaxID=1785 RepID=UPI003A8491B3
VRCRINRLSVIDRVAAEPIHRYEHDRPGSLIHVNVTKFGNTPNGGRHRFVGRQQGLRHRAATSDREGTRNARYLHTVIDDHSRVAYVEMHTNEREDTAVGVLHRTVAWFAEHGVTVERVLSDNGSYYRSFAWSDACAKLGIVHKRTRPYRPQTNGKIDRFHRTLADGWTYARFHTSETERREALPGWTHFYNRHRRHSTINGTPINRLNNLPGHHN